MKTSQVSIIIPSRNIEYLRNCVLSILRTKTDVSYEIMVIHNGNNEAINSFVDGYNLNQKILKGQFNYSLFNNLAVEATNTEYLLFLNDDTEVITDWWLELFLNEHIISDGIGAIGAALLYEDNKVQSAGDSVGLKHYYRGKATAWNNKTVLSKYPYEVDTITGACLFIKRDTFMEVGQFDMNFVLGYGDVDLGLKLRKAGYKNIIVPGVQLYHIEYGTRTLIDDGAELLDKKWRSYVFWYKLKLKFNRIISKSRHGIQS